MFLFIPPSVLLFNVLMFYMSFMLIVLYKGGYSPSTVITLLKSNVYIHVIFN